MKERYFFRTFLGAKRKKNGNLNALISENGLKDIKQATCFHPNPIFRVDKLLITDHRDFSPSQVDKKEDICVKKKKSKFQPYY